MMGIQSGQIQMVILDIDSMIPENHLLRQIKKDLLTNCLFNFVFVIFSLKPYKKTGDPVSLYRFYQSF